jgi:hypothetical protein
MIFSKSLGRGETEQLQGFMEVRPVIPESIGDTVLARQPQEEKNQVSQDGQNHGRVAPMSATGIFSHRDIPHIVDAIFDGPMTSP